MYASYWIYVSSYAHSRHSMHYGCDSFLSISLEVSLASAWIGNDRADPWKANTQNIGYISLRCAFMLFEHEVANIESFFKTWASTYTRGELLSTSLSVCVLVKLLVESFFQDDCSYVWQISAAERCEWVRNTEDCYSDSMIQYTILLFCYFRSENIALFVGGLVLIFFWLLYLFLILGTIADNL